MEVQEIRSRNDLGDWLNQAGLTGNGVEIGVQVGEVSERILSTWKGFLYLVDPWKEFTREEYFDETGKTDWEAAHDQTVKRMTQFPYRHCIVRLTSDEAMETFEP